MMKRDAVSRDPGLLEAARRLHQDSLVIDLHQDTLLWSRLLGYAAQREHRPLCSRLLGVAPPLFGQSDLPRLRRGGIAGVGLGVVTNPFLRGPARRSAVRSLALLRQLACSCPEQLLVARRAADIDAARRSGKVAAFAVLEGVHCLDPADPDALLHLVELGLAGVGLVHFTANAAGTSSSSRSSRRNEPLSRWGRELVERCNRLGLLLDLAHLDGAGTIEAARLSRQPVVVSHTGVQGVHPSWRNVDDASLRAVADGGGCIGIIFYPGYLGSGWRGGLERVVAHAAHVVRVVGEDAVAIGTDIDGFLLTLPRGIRGSADMPLLTAALLAAGWPERRVRKLLGENARRV
ncbi:MAG: peptidase, partial [Deltaproteobacteria bacterium]|nr:peptidase [Deltaproteobacteria bacterium]